MGIIVIIIGLLLPAALLLKKKHELLAYWIAFICVIDLFNSQQFLNISAFKLTGLVVTPYLISQFKVIFKNKLIRLLLVYFSYLLILGVIFGLIFPWVDPTGIRAVKDLAPSRAILHLGSLFLEFMAIIYLGVQFSKKKSLIDSFFLVFLLGVLITCIGAFIESYFLVDIYHFFTKGNQMIMNSLRPRGFSYEPRGLGQSTAVGLTLLMFYYDRIPKKVLFISLPFCIYFGFIMSMSAAGIVTLLIGLTLTIFFSLLKKRLAFFKSSIFKITLILTLLLPLSYFVLGQQTKDNFKSHLGKRSYILFGTSFLEKIEDQEAAALNFLVKNPLHFLIGTGPGLIYLPSVEYRIDKYLSQDHQPEKNAFNTLPHMGWLLQLSNGGALSLGLLIFIFFAFYQNLRRENSDSSNRHLQLFLLLSCLYLFQIRLIYYAALSIGLAYSLKDKDSVKK